MDSVTQLFQLLGMLLFATNGLVLLVMIIINKIMMPKMNKADEKYQAAVQILESYSKLQKSTVEYSKWLNNYDCNKVVFSEDAIRDCQDRFKDCLDY